MCFNGLPLECGARLFFSYASIHFSHSYPCFSHVCCSLSDNFEEAAAATAAATTTATTTAVATTTITTQTNNKKMGKKVENKSISQVMANQEMSKRKRQIIWCGVVLNNIQIRRQIRTVGMYVFHLCKHSSSYKDKICFSCTKRYTHRHTVNWSDG